MIFNNGDRLISTRGRVVRRFDLNQHCLGQRVKVCTSIGRAAIVLHLKRKTRVGDSVGSWIRSESKLERTGKVSDWYELSCFDCCAVVRQSTSRWKRCNFDGYERILRRIAKVGEPELNRNKALRAILRHRDRSVHAAGRSGQQMTRLKRLQGQSP